MTPRDTVTVGPFTVEFIRVTHSMPDCVAVAITTPVGVLRLHRRLQDRPDADRPRSTSTCTGSPSWARRGVLALFSDSTNVDRKGFTGPETDVIEGFEEIFASTDGKLVVATFSSSIYRMQVLVDLAVQFERRVAFVGRSMVQSSEIAQNLGYLRIPAGIQIKDTRHQHLPGRPGPVHRDGLAGRAAGGAVAHRHRRPPDRARLSPDDTVVFSARAIPGQRKGHRPDDQPRHAAWRARDHGRQRSACTCPATAPRRN